MARFFAPIAAVLTVFVFLVSTVSIAPATTDEEKLKKKIGIIGKKTVCVCTDPQSASNGDYGDLSHCYHNPPGWEERALCARCDVPYFDSAGVTITIEHCYDFIVITK